MKLSRQGHKYFHLVKCSSFHVLGNRLLFSSYFWKHSLQYFICWKQSLIFSFYLCFGDLPTFCPFSLLSFLVSDDHCYIPFYCRTDIFVPSVNENIWDLSFCVSLMLLNSDFCPSVLLHMTVFYHFYGWTGERERERDSAYSSFHWLKFGLFPYFSRYQQYWNKNEAFKCCIDIAFWFPLEI